MKHEEIFAKLRALAALPDTSDELVIAGFHALDTAAMHRGDMAQANGWRMLKEAVMVKIERKEKFLALVLEILDSIADDPASSGTSNAQL